LRSILIIGGGFSGAMVATQLLRQAGRPLSITILERSAEIGRGVAYGTCHECHLLNAPAAGMSALEEEPLHFLRWAQDRVPGGMPAWGFAPRLLYGAYVAATLADDEARAAPGVHLERRRGEAVAARLAGSGGAAVTLADGNELRADRVVLALGNLPPADPPVPDPGFYRSRRYLGHAWADGAWSDIARDDPVLLLGSGLTMMDLAAALASQGHSAAMLVVSRRGQLPQAHGPAAPPPFTLHWPDEPPARVVALLSLVRRELRRAAAAGIDWRSVIDALRPHTTTLWRALPAHEKRRFLRHLRGHWDSHRHRAAPATARVVSALQASGQLRLYAGRVRAFREDGAGVDVTVELRGSRRTLVLRAGRVINCTGPECDYRQLRMPLIASLRATGLLQPDELGLGLAATEDGALIDLGGAASRVFYTLGPPRKGALWETTAVREIRTQAAQLASLLLAPGDG
jgi:uncharacterized NAD(P)/FAD-binding protein YdhS